MDRLLKVNIVKRRTHSLFRQGSYWYSCLPAMRPEWINPLMKRFNQLLEGTIETYLRSDAVASMRPDAA